MSDTKKTKPLHCGIFLLVFAALSPLGARAGLLLQEEGALMTNIDQPKAAVECERLNRRLPTVRETAEQAVPYGAQIVEIDEAPWHWAWSPPDDYTFISLGSPDLVRREWQYQGFWYSAKDYQRPSGSDDEGLASVLWTDSHVWIAKLVLVRYAFHPWDGNIHPFQSGLFLPQHTAACVQTAQDLFPLQR